MQAGVRGLVQLAQLAWAATALWLLFSTQNIGEGFFYTQVQQYYAIYLTQSWSSGLPK